MKTNDSISATFVIIFATLSFGLGLALPGIIEKINNLNFEIEKISETTNYKTVKEVEDTCRAMIVSYETDKRTYEQFKDKTGEAEGWANEAKMRANETAAAYNNYILKNSFVWQEDIPDDIKNELEYIVD